MDATGTIVTQYRQAYSIDLLENVTEQMLVNLIKRQIEETRREVDEKFDGVTIKNEMVSIVVEIIHDGIER